MTADQAPQTYAKQSTSQILRCAENVVENELNGNKSALLKQPEDAYNKLNNSTEITILQNKATTKVT